MATTETDAITSAEPTDESSLFTARRIRLGALYLATAATLVLAVLMMGRELSLAFTGWYVDLGIHQVHDLTLFAMLWIALLAPMALLLYRPRSRVNTVLAPLVFLLPFVAITAQVNSSILMLPVIFGALSLVVFALHPAGRDLFRFDRVERVNRALAGLLVVAAIPLLAYAGDQMALQFAVTDEHALFGHFGGMAIASVYVVLMGALAIVRRRDWRFAAYSAGLVAVVIGAASILFAVESSVGPLWGTLSVVFGVVFVAAVEYVRRTEADEPTAMEPETAELA
jgi:hypothetical protein